ncbi:MAG: hypothetical protein J7M14_03605 [Planctomycetes bacterium]|nr:hypothetical protein [Planctomycetota bacterium]
MRQTGYYMAGADGCGRGGFSVTELVVVTAIIAVTGAMFVPVLNQVKDAAQQPACMTNQKAIVNALLLYHADYSCFPYNYANYYEIGDGGFPTSPDYRGDNQRWAMGCINPYLTGAAPGDVNLRYRDEGEFSDKYVCPSADLDAVYLNNPNDKYHACYWTSPAVRLNQGWGTLFGPGNATVGQPPGNDRNSCGFSRVYFPGICALDHDGVPSKHWRSIYFPRLGSLPSPSSTAFSGDTRDVGIGDPEVYGYPAGWWRATPGQGTSMIRGTQEAFGFDRHGGSMIVSYADGHVAPTTLAEETERMGGNESYVYSGGALIELGGPSDQGKCFQEVTRDRSGVETWGDFTRFHTLPQMIVP